MALGVRLKKSLTGNGNSRFPPRSVKITGDGLKPVADNRKRESKQTVFKGRRRKYDSDDNMDSHSEQHRSSRADFAAAKGKRLEMNRSLGRNAGKGRVVARPKFKSPATVDGRKGGFGKRRDGYDDGSRRRKRSDGAGREPRGQRRKGDDKTVFYEKDFEERRRGDGNDSASREQRWKRSDRKEERGLRVDAPGDKLTKKGKKMDRHNGDDEDQSVEKNAEGKDQPKQNGEKKYVTRLVRKIDQSGKKIKVLQKRSDDGSLVTEVPLLKKKKRTIKIDPYDASNKRLDDGDSSSVNIDTEKAVEEDTKVSKNAQFRAIQPSPSILSFVEDNLLGRRRLIELQNAGYNTKISAPLDNVPFSTSTERERIEENVFRNKLEFFAAAKISSSFPPPAIPEIAFAGRSNVGKSSLLNALTRQWGVVRTSDKPGLTQTINFFKLASKLSLVDLPGYGFAYAKEEVKDAWEELVKEYVSTRVGLQRVCLLIDTKWGMKPRDHELIDLMERSQTPYQIVLTKTDVVFPIDVARCAMQIQENLKKNKSIVNPVMMVSSKSGAGIRSLRTVLAKIAHFVKL